MEKQTDKYPVQRASWFSRLFFCWAPVYFYKSLKNRKSPQNQSYTPLKTHESNNLGDKLEDFWDLQYSKNGNKATLWYPLWRIFGLKLVALGVVFFVLELTIKMPQPWLIGQLVKSIKTGSKNDNYLYAALLLSSSTLGVIITHSYMLAIHHLGMKIRISCSSLIYRKMLKMDTELVRGNSSGTIINLLASDVVRFDLAPMYFLQLIVAPIEIISILICLYCTVGLTSLSGIIFLVLFIPIPIFMGKLVSKYRSRTAAKTDQRVSLIGEIINGIKAVKLFNWETCFCSLVQEIRKLEMRQIRNTSDLKSLNVSFMVIINRTGIFLSVVTHCLLYQEINVEYVFMVSAFYGLLRQSLTIYLPYSINNFAETRVAVQRIRKFLQQAENSNNSAGIIYVAAEKSGKLIEQKEHEDIPNGYLPNENKNLPFITLENVCAKWKHSNDLVLKSLNFSLSPGDFVAIHGPIGSGKSTFFSVILKECPISSGTATIQASISYAPQTPFLVNGTVKDNILFGSKFEPAKYKQVVQVCELLQDFQSFPNSDETEVGERGVLLSGGQKSRINLARAVYKNSDVYLLDDPLSSLDVQVGRRIYGNCILAFLKAKSVILISHNPEYWKSADQVYTMADGKLELFDAANMENFDAGNDPESCVEIKKAVTKNTEKIVENTKSAAVSSKTYRKYAFAGANIYSLSLLLLSFITAQVMASGVDYFLGFWVDWNSNNKSEEKISWFTIDNSIKLYSILIVSMSLTAIFRSLFFFRICVQASRNLHNLMFTKILKAPMDFFNQNSSGRIVNRFSKDMGSVDEELPMIIMETLQIGTLCIGSFAILVFINWLLLVPTLLLVLLLFFFRKMFLVSSRHLKRLEAAEKSPVFSHVTTTIQGLTTIRAFEKQHLFQEEFENKQNVHSSAFYMFLTCSRAFGFWIDLICVIYVIIATCSAIWLDSTAGTVGLAITQSINLVGITQWGLRQWSQMENQMTSVERLLEYTELPNEETLGETEKIFEPTENWPNTGEIVYSNITLRYQNTPAENAALKNVNLEIKGGQKVAIVGRTGSGKTSLISVLYKLYKFEGTVKIDGVNLSTVPIHELRSRISIMPQDVFVFRATLRRNLDPGGCYDDAKLWAVLEQAELKNFVKELPDGLSTALSEGASELSVGQKQLFCLARAMLKNNRILVLDEATSSIDSETNSTVQNVIRTQFGHCTVISVAHRLEFVMEADKIVVMDSGSVLEYGEPRQLAADANSEFYNILNNSNYQ